jgi:quaternary ammonium compound-resistance protein SugE
MLNMPWLYLVLAGLLEIGWAIGLKYTNGFTRLWPSVGTVACMAASFFLLALALKTIPVGTAYAVWTGIGAAGTAVLGMILFGESREVARLVCLVMIVAGTVGLKIFSGRTPDAVTSPHGKTELVDSSAGASTARLRAGRAAEDQGPDQAQHE